MREQSRGKLSASPLMRNLTNFLSGFFLLLVFVAAITFSYFNTEPVRINYGSLSFAPLPVSVWIFSAFVCGGILGLILGLGVFRQLKYRAEICRLKKELANAKQEVNHLRTLSLRDLD